MADKVVTDFLTKIKAKSGEAIKWFRNIVKKTQRAAFPAVTGRKEFTGDRSIGVTSRPLIGKMYLFQYKAKGDEKLPFDYAKDGFYGINLHYLPINDRTNLMIRLIKAQGGSGNMSENYKLKLNYNIITKFKPAIPCIKRYLFKQVRGQGLYGIGGEDWSYAAALPLHKFQKQSAKYVWSQSALMY